MWPRISSLLRKTGEAAVGGAVIYMFSDVVGWWGTVEGPSMQPTLNPIEMVLNGQCDVVWIQKFRARQKPFARGDVVMMRSPIDKDALIVKRIVGLPGDIVRPLDSLGRFDDGAHYVRVPLGHCWIEGDNHAQSRDSNTYGPVSLSLVEGRIRTILWPLSRTGRIQDKRKDVPEGRVIIPDP